MTIKSNPLTNELRPQMQENSQSYLIVKQHKKEESGAERRKFRRFDIRLLGRYMREDKTEYPCQAINISAGGAAVAAPTLPEMGENIILYLDHIGRTEGIVARVGRDNFAIRYKISETIRDRLNGKISWLINQMEMGFQEKRFEGRFATNNKDTTLVLPGDIEISCVVENFSLSGASIITNARPAIGSVVKLGCMNGEVKRHTDRGIALEFTNKPTAAHLINNFGKMTTRT